MSDHNLPPKLNELRHFGIGKTIQSVYVSRVAPNNYAYNLVAQFTEGDDPYQSSTRQIDGFACFDDAWHAAMHTIGDLLFAHSQREAEELHKIVREKQSVHTKKSWKKVWDDEFADVKKAKKQKAKR